MRLPTFLCWISLAAPGLAAGNLFTFLPYSITAIGRGLTQSDALASLTVQVQRYQDQCRNQDLGHPVLGAVLESQDDPEPFVETQTLTCERVLASPASLPTSLRIFPNPWRADRALVPSIHFDAVASGSSVTLFTASARFVKTVRAEGTSADWDLTNDAGQSVASGLYFYLLTDPDGRQVRGPVSVIR